MEDAERQCQFHRAKAFSPSPESDGTYELMTMPMDQGGRYVVLMNPFDMDAEGPKQDDTVTLSTKASDGVERTLSELQVVAYYIPCGSIAGYYPEWHGLIPLWHYAEGSKVPAVNPFRRACQS